MINTEDWTWQLWCLDKKCGSRCCSDVATSQRSASTLESYDGLHHSNITKLFCEPLMVIVSDTAVHTSMFFSSFLLVPVHASFSTIVQPTLKHFWSFVLCTYSYILTIQQHFLTVQYLNMFAWIFEFHNRIRNMFFMFSDTVNALDQSTTIINT